MRTCIIILCIVVSFCLAGTALAQAPVSDQELIGLVDQVSSEIEKDAQGTLQKIISGVHPYQNKDDKSFYVFVYDTEVTIVAHPDNKLIGRSYKGKPDVRGKKFRDDIVSGALQNKTGWVDYSYQKPGEKGIHQKTTYYKLVTGNDGKQYIVCSGKYLAK